MGQYHFICNLDKREYLHPHRFGDGLKMLEFGCSPDGTLTGLTILLACSHSRGGGDLHPDEGERGELLMKHVAGRWAGDRIAIIGDYSEDEDFPGFHSKDGPWESKGTWVDISAITVEAMEMDSYIKEERTDRYGFGNRQSECVGVLTEQGVIKQQGATQEGVTHE